MFKSKTADLVIKGVCAFGFGFFVAQECSILKMWHCYKKNKELRILVKELDDYMKKNLYNDQCSPEEYHQTVQARIEFIKVVKSL